MDKATEAAKNGQVEMIGLVIVVILLVIGLLFYFKFGILREDEVKDDSSRELTYVNNLMGAVFNVMVCEEQYSIEDVLVRCFEDEQVGSSDLFCGSLGSCDYVESEIEEIIGDLELKNYQKYSVSIKKGSETFVIKGDCETGVLGSTTIVTPEREHYTVNFRVCKSAI